MTTNEERIKELDHLICDRKRRLELYEEARKGKFPSCGLEIDGEHVENWDKLWKLIKRCEEEYRTYSAEREYLFIQPILEANGIKTNLYPEARRGVRVTLIKFNDKRYLYIDNDYFDSNDKDFATQGITVMYTEAREILYVNNKTEKTCFRHQGSTFTDYTNYSFKGNLPETGRIVLNNDTDLIIDLNGIDGFEFNDAHHFKKEDGRYRLIHAFKYGNSMNEHFHILNTTDDTELGEYSGRLYNIKTGEFLNDLQFNTIYDIDSKIPDFDCEGSSTIKEIMKKDNVLLYHIDRYTSDIGYIHYFGFVDTNGVLKGDIMYYVEVRYDRDNVFSQDYFGYRIFHSPITNDNFNEKTFKVIPERLKKYYRDVMKARSNRREKESAKYKKIKSEKQAERREYLSGVINGNPNSLKFVPKEKDKKEQE